MGHCKCLDGAYDHNPQDRHHGHDPKNVLSDVASTGLGDARQDRSCVTQVWSIPADPLAGIEHNITVSPLTQ